MSALAWIVVGGVLMSAIALSGSLTLLLSDATLKRVLRPLVAFAAGSLIGGAFFHMIPAALLGASPASVMVHVAVGFATFFALEALLHWHHCQRASSECRQPMTYLILIGDGLHNFLGGLSIGGVFLIDVELGVAAWLAAAAHEIPQELGDFAVLVHGGWSKRRALAFNALSGVTFLVGGLTAYAAGQVVAVDWLVPLAAGNFLYIGASDLVPEVNKPHSLASSFVHLAVFTAALALMFALAS